MVDNTNPNNQFHPYQPMKDTPAAERPVGGLAGMLNNMDVQGTVSKARDYAKNKPGMALGALAALAIGFGLLRGRR